MRPAQGRLVNNKVEPTKFYQANVEVPFSFSTNRISSEDIIRY